METLAEIISTPAPAERRPAKQPRLLSPDGQGGYVVTRRLSFADLAQLADEITFERHGSYMDQWESGVWDRE